MDFTSLLPAVAFGLDLALGDPQRWPHPVRLIGAALTHLEPLAATLSPLLKRLYGLAVALCLCACVYAAVLTLVRLPGLGWLFSIYLAFAGLALGQLLREARRVSGLISSGRLDEARRELSYLVSRDTSVLDESGLWRTLAETLSENFCDGFVAPFIYLVLGGPPLLWAYKTASTMDSMWGYKTERFRELGWAGARLDDVLAFVPARVSAFALLAAGMVMGLDSRRAFRNFRADARTMSSPNAGWPMAAAAWLCDASMGGETIYFGAAIQKPEMGPGCKPWTADNVGILYKLVLSSGIGLVFLATGMVLLGSYVFS
ncbi:MAG: adenosylcobinamide-phosphate synthase CbiB [Acidobacteriota bacterium]